MKPHFFHTESYQYEYRLFVYRTHPGPEHSGRYEDNLDIKTKIFQDRMAIVDQLGTRQSQNNKKTKALQNIDDNDKRKAGLELIIDKENDVIHKQKEALIRKFNQELGIGIDFSKYRFVDMNTKGKGMLVLLDHRGELLYIGLRPDGSYETREDKSDRTITYFDSRTRKRTTYGPRPVPGAHIPEKINPDGTRWQSLVVANTPEQQRFMRERGGGDNALPKTE